MQATTTRKFYRRTLAAVASTNLLLLPLPAYTQAPERTGVSNPDSTIITASPDPAPEATAPAPRGFRPYTETGGIPTATVPELTHRTPEAVAEPTDAAVPNPDAGIVAHVASRPGEIPNGTVVRIKMLTPISTVTTKAGTPFSGELTEAILRDGRVAVPVGSIVDGRVTEVRGGRRIHGTAAIHLEPHTVTLPDGQQYLLHARVIDTASYRSTRVDSEGTILRSDHVKGTLAAMSLTTGGAAATGAVFGGAPGALIGAGVGAGISTAWWLKQDRQTALPKDALAIFLLTAPMNVAPVSASIPATDVQATGE